MCITAEERDAKTCARSGISACFRDNSRNVDSNGTRPTESSNSAAAIHADVGPRAQLPSNKVMPPNAVTLRRRLSKIFHFERGLIVLRTSFPPPSGTRGRIHAAICQSPRIQRCRRLTSAM